jgi:type VI secretion system protein ImpH
MAAEGGGATAPLAETIFDEAHAFGFFQAVRLLERLYRGRLPVGRDGDPAREAVRFRSHASMMFPPSEIHSLAPPADGDGAEPPPEMTVAFMGLTGPLGVLPAHYTELVMERARYRDTALWHFLDIFGHRLLSLFYRAWEKHRFPVAYERGEPDRFTEYLFHLIGLGTGHLRGRMSFPDQGLLFYAGLVAQRPHSAGALAAMLGDYFGVPARVEQFSGRWLELGEGNVSRLGVANCELGVSAVAGSRVWDHQSKFQVQFGPLTYQELKDLLPNGPAHRPAAEIVRFMAGAEFDFDLRLTLKAAEVPSCVLTTRARRRPMLGWTTWLKTRRFAEDDSQVVLRPKV